jgi:hypothetical protein
VTNHIKEAKIKLLKKIEKEMNQNMGHLIWEREKKIEEMNMNQN